MDIASVLINDPMHLKIVVSGSTSSYMNAMRRVALSDISAPSIHTIDIEKNDTDLVPEVLAHQIGMIAIRASGPATSGDFVMDVENDSSSVMSIYAHHFVPQSSELSIVNPDTLLGYLSPNQHIRLRASTKWGTAKEHSKWTCCHCTFYPVPDIEVRQTHPVHADTGEMLASACPTKVFDIEDGGWLRAARPLDCMHCGECVSAFGSSDSGVGVTVCEKRGFFVFEIESYGTFTSLQILNKIFDVIDRRLKVVQRRVDRDLPKLPSTPPSSPSEGINSVMCTY